METRLLIGGEQVERDGVLLAVENPATEEKWWYPYAPGDAAPPSGAGA
jgi:hypothetical protein